MVDAPKPKPDPSRDRPINSSPQGGARAPRTLFALSEEETEELGRALARNLEGGELILLEGDLGLGKTVFARGVAAGLGVPPEDVNSPSFTLVQEYPGGRLPVFHVDLYRIDSVEEISTLGLDEILSSGAVTIVEWGEKLPDYYRLSAFIARFHDVGEGCRRIELVEPQAEGTPRHGDA
jgi:tRNA threonylcarbamoyladenosine biosynthesis protein TsaE